jgi:hypothetical protein
MAKVKNLIKLVVLNIRNMYREFWMLLKPDIYIPCRYYAYASCGYVIDFDNSGICPDCINPTMELIK